MAQRPAKVLRFGRYAVNITRPDKVLFPEDGVTKGELIDYYQRIAGRMLPHLRGRPLSMQRYPDGIGQPGFFQQAASFYYPDWIRKVRVPKQGGSVNHVVCDNTATLVYLANQACVTPHAWLSRLEKLDCPDQMIFDLDPSGEDFEPVRAAALGLKELLEGLGLPAFLKTTGSRGLHVVVPLNRGEGFDSIRAFARQVAEELVARDPQRWTLEQRKDKRAGRVFVDTNRNAYGQTVAPAFAARARRRAPVSTPLDWSELDGRGLRSDSFTIRNLFERTEDPWKDFWRRAASLAPARRKMGTGRSRHAA